MNVLFVINSLDIGGAETFLMRLMGKLNSQNHSCFLYVLDPKKKNPSFEQAFFKETKATLIKDPEAHNPLLAFIFNKLNAVLQRFGYKDFYNNFLQKRKEKYFKRLLVKKYHIDLINSHLLSSDIFASTFFKPLLKIPHVITMQGCYDSLINIGGETMVADAVSAIKNCNGMTYVADKNLSFLQQQNIHTPAIAKRIYNGISSPDKSKFKHRSELGLRADDFIVGQVSRSIESKGMEVAIKAVETLVEKRGMDKIKLILLGPENDYYARLKDKYAEKKYILFPGETNNPVEWCGMFDIGILPTWFASESCPSSIIEYLSCGRPVVSTTIGEIPGMIDAAGDKAGILVPYDKDNGKPSVEEIADSIAAYYNDKELYRRHSELAKEAFTKFEITKIEELYLEVYKQVLTKQTD